MPHLCVNVIGEIQWRCAVGKIYHIALGGKHINPVLGHLETELFRHTPGIARLLVPVQYLAQPGYLLLIGVGGGVSGIGPLVPPVRAHP